MLFRGRFLCNSNSFQLLTFVTKSSILNAARVLDLPMPKERRVEQNTYGKQLLLWVIALLMPVQLAIWMNLQVKYLKDYIV